MATWEDGPEYAPRERPTAFALPVAPPLPEPVIEPSLAAGAPPQRPAGYVADPRSREVPQPPLSGLAPVDASARDPQQAFDVMRSTLTAQDSAWGAAHHAGAGALAAGEFDPHRPFPAHAGSAEVATTPAPSFPAPTGAPASAPVGLAGPAGTPQQGALDGWFAPVEQAPAPQAAAGSSFLAAITPGVVITLAVGSIISVVAPVAYLSAFFLAQRVKVAGTAVRTVFALGTTVLALVAMAGLATDGILPAMWWQGLGATATWVCGITLAVVAVVVYLGLRSPGGDAQE